MNPPKKSKIRKPTDFLVHFQPIKHRNPPSTVRIALGLATHMDGRNKERDYNQAVNDWKVGLCFMAGVYAAVPSSKPMLKHEAEQLLITMFGSGFKMNKFHSTAERRRIKKNGDAAWRLADKVKKQCGG